MMKEQIATLVKGLRTEKQITSALDKAHIGYEVDMECGYLNIRIPVADGYVRIYKNSRKEVEVQQMRRVKCEYTSGAPMFTASNSWF